METSLDNILKKYGPQDPKNLIPILQAVQTEQGFISREAVQGISNFLRIPPNQIFSVATFYRSFSLTPKGKCCVSVCMGTACHVRGAKLIVEEAERRLGIQAGDTTPDLNFTLETVNCLGACALGPVVVVNGEYRGQMDMAKTGDVIENIQDNVNGEKS